MCSLEEFEVVLENAASPDNGIRQQAEKALENAKNNSTWLLQALLQVTSVSQKPVVQHMGAVLLRRYISRTKDSVYDALPEGSKAEVKQQLLAQLGSQANPMVRRGVAHCVAGLAIRLLEPLQWPELFPALFAAVNSGSTEKQEVALLVFSTIAPHFTDAVFGQFGGALKDMCQHALCQAASTVKVAGLTTAMEIVGYSTNQQVNDNFRQLLPALTQAVGASITAGDIASASKGVEAFITVAEVAPEFFGQHLRDVFAPFIQIASADGMDSNLRRLGLEFCMTLGEADPKGTRKIPNFLATVVPLAMELQLNLDHDSDWAVTAPEDEDDDQTDFDVGMEAMDRMAIALGGKHMHPVVSPLIMQFGQNGCWKHRVVALTSLGQCAEGCNKEFKPLLPQMAHMIHQCFEDQHERVRAAAITCMAQFCTDFSPEFQSQFHSVFFPSLMKRMTDVPRVAGLAATACINFVEGAKTDDTEPYLDNVLTCLLQLLHSTQHRFVKVNAVSTISAIADHAETLFEKYYDATMPWLKNVVCAAQCAPADRMLRAKALECLTKIALAVGKSKFGPDAAFVLQAMQQLEGASKEADDPLIQYLTRAWGRLAECLEEDFGPYAPAVVPRLINQAAQKTDIVIADEEDQEKEEGVQSITLSLKGLGDKRISIKTSELEEKSLAVAVLSQIFEACGEVLCPYVEQYVPIAVPLLKFVYVEEVRENVARTLPGLVKAAMTTAQAAPLVQHFVTAMADAIRAESQSHIKAAQLLSLGQVIEAGPKDAMGPTLAKEIGELMQKSLDDGWKARGNLQHRRRQADEEDAEELDEELETEEDIICQAIDVVSACLKQQPEATLTWYGHFYPSFVRMANPGAGFFENRIALCALTSYLENHGTEHGASSVPAIVESFMRYTDPKHEDPDIVQVAAYGLGTAAERLGDAFSSFVPQAVTRLTALLTARGADDDWESAVCNAIASLMRLNQFHGSHSSGCCKDEALLPGILSALPAKGDEEEAKYVHKRFVELLEQPNPVIMGAGNCNMSSLQTLCNSMIGSDCVDKETNQKLKAMISA